jgi:ATP-dependent Clp protease ATP-binding subunit ClpA
MNRLIQDTVEQHLADLIIREQLNPGQTVEFTVIGNGDTKNDLLPKIK